MDLITESAEVGNSNTSVLSGNRSLDENPIRRVTDQVHNSAVETGAEKLKETESTGNVPNDVKKDISSQQLKANSGIIPEKIVRRLIMFFILIKLYVIISSYRVCGFRPVLAVQ